MGQKDWSPSEYTWICSEHFVSGAKSNNPLVPNYVPTLFKHIDSPIKRRLEGRVQDFERRQSFKRRRVEVEKERLDKEVEVQLKLKEQEEKKKLEEEAERKRLEEIELERQHQEALLKHHEMVLESKRKQSQTMRGKYITILGYSHLQFCVQYSILQLKTYQQMTPTHVHCLSNF